MLITDKSHFMMELQVVSWIPHDSIQERGLEQGPRNLNLSFPIVIT